MLGGLLKETWGKVRVLYVEEDQVGTSAAGGSTTAGSVDQGGNQVVLEAVTV